MNDNIIEIVGPKGLKFTAEVSENLVYQIINIITSEVMYRVEKRSQEIKES